MSSFEAGDEEMNEDLKYPSAVVVDIDESLRERADEDDHDASNTANNDVFDEKDGGSDPAHQSSSGKYFAKMDEQLQIVYRASTRAGWVR